MSFGGGNGGFGSGGSPPDTIGTFQLQLLPWQDRVPAEQIFQSIRDKTKDIPGLDIQIAAQENGPPAGKAINLKVEVLPHPDGPRSVTRLPFSMTKDTLSTAVTPP